MKVVIVTILLLLPAIRIAPPILQRINASSYGTLIASFIGKNGIVVSSDSRTVLYNPRREVVTYFEETSKIFQFRNFLIAVAGQYTFETTSIRNLLKEVREADSLSTLDLYSIHDAILSYAHTRLSTTEYFTLYTNQFIIAGYDDNIPTILYYDGHNKQEFSGRGYISNLPEENHNKTLKKHIRTLTVGELVPFSIDFVKNVEEARNNKDKWSIIGGPVSTASIMNNKVTWIKDQNRNSYESGPELYEAYKKGKVRIVFRSAKDSADFPRRFVRS
jgi:hypothetical protein